MHPRSSLAVCLLTAVSLLATLAPPASAFTLPPYNNWQAPVTLSNPGVNYTGAIGSVAEANGSFRVLYFEDTNGTATIFARLLSGSTGVWGPAVTVATMPLASLGCTNLISLPDGRIWLLHFFGPTSNATLRIIEYRPGVGWGAPQQLSNGTGNRVTNCPRAEVEPDGRLVVAWMQATGPYFSAWARYYSPASGWEDAVLLETEDLGNVIRAPFPLSDGLGNFSVVWTQSNGTATALYASERPSGSGWGARFGLQSAPGYNVTTMTFAKMASDKVLVVWNQTGPPTRYLWSSVHDPATGWQAPVSIDAGGLIPVIRGIAAAGGGGAALVWTGQAATKQLWANRYAPASGWSAPTRVDSSDAGDVSAGYIDFTADTLDNAWCLWAQSNGSATHIWGALLDGALGWQPAAVLDNTSGNASTPLAAPHGSGNLTLAWTEDRDGGYRNAVMSRSFVHGYGWTNITPAFDDPAWDPGPYGAFFGVQSDGTALMQLDIVDTGNGTQHSAVAVGGIPYRVANPPLAVSSPADGTVTSLNTIEVVGTTERGVYVTVNGVPTVMAADGSFHLVVPIVAGNNSLTVVAAHPLGFSTTIALNVVQRDLVREYQIQLDQLLAALANETAALASSEARVTVLESRISDLVNQTGALSAQGNGSAAQLNLTLAELDAARAEMNATRAQLALTQLQLSLTAADLNATRLQLNATDTKANDAAAQSASAEQKAQAADTRAENLASSVSLLTLVAVASLAVGAASLVMGMRKKQLSSAPPPGPPPAK